MARRRWLVALAASMTALTFMSPASAQESARSVGSARPVQEANDIVHLRDGRSYRGHIVEIVPADHVTLVGEDGETKTVPWSDIDRIAPDGGATISANPRASEPPAGGAVVPTTPASFSGESEPPPRWHPNRPLIVTGTVLFAAGYLPVAAVGVSSAAGLVGRAAVLILTLGLGCLDARSGYLCRGQHGAIQLLVPIVGPILFAGGHPRDSIVNENGRPLSDVTKALLYTSAGIQTAGILTLLSGLVFGGHERVGQPPVKPDPRCHLPLSSSARSVRQELSASRWARLAGDRPCTRSPSPSLDYWTKFGR